ncbi:MAG TPA: HemK/PrmC family methyltransferase, partial [Pyrinomonadaceae bacterium]|nr:HemK/PrmC family methyltransferase [Pyrinomonadaceae bacterium]
MAASIAVLILEASKLLHSAGVPDSRREASALMGHVLGRDRTFIISHSETQISDDQLAEYRRVVHRRSAGEPLQYITGTQEFFKLDFYVTTDVLIPRPETELLVETALDLIPKKDSSALICDVGTGSGCIAISLLSERPNAKAVAIDI